VKNDLIEMVVGMGWSWIKLVEGSHMQKPSNSCNEQRRLSGDDDNNNNWCMNMIYMVHNDDNNWCMIMIYMVHNDDNNWCIILTVDYNSE